MEQNSSQKILGGVLIGLAMLVAVGVLVLRDRGAVSVVDPPDLDSMAADTAAIEAAPSSDVPGFTAAGGQAAPDFSLATADGSTFSLADHRGEVVVVNFWATWCLPCRQEIPEFIDLQKELGKEGLQFVGISLDEEGMEVIRPFAKEMSINYPLVHDPGDVADAFGGVYALPTTFIIDREGRVQRKITGMATTSVIMPILNTLLSQ